MTQIELFGKNIIQIGSNICYVKDEKFFVNTVLDIIVDDGHEFYVSKCKCGKCPKIVVPIENVIEVFNEDGSMSGSLLSGQEHLH